MAVRREKIVLDVEDLATAKLARAAAAAKMFGASLDDVDGRATGASRGLDKTSASTDQVGASARKSGPDIDKFSGRLGLLVAAATTLGPALIPLGGAIIPVLTASLAGLGAAAGGIGAAVLAFQGVGDGIKALDEYRLEPTAENLQAVRLEMEKLGPAGADFARYIANLEPVFRDLQNVAREGMFPGIEDGIDALLTRGPQVTRIITELSEGMGNIARGAGQGVASDEWTPFFDYIESDAKPTLEAFASSAGNVALGVANMLTAFAPLSRDFTGGLESATQAFADWSAELGSNNSFQSFLEYLQTNGPRAVEFLGTLAESVAALLEAAAPYGAVALSALTNVLKVFTAIASSDAGPLLFAAAAGLLAFNRAAAITASVGPKLAATFAGLSAASLGKSAAGIGLLALSLSDLDDKAGMTNTTMGAFAGLMAGGPVGLAIGTLTGQFLDFSAASDKVTASIDAADAAMRDNNADAMREQLKGLTEEYDRLFNGDAKISNFGSQIDAVTGSFLEFTGQAADMRGRIAELQGHLKSGGDLADLFGQSIGQTGDQLRVAANSAEAFSGALARLNGWFDKRDAVRGYKDAIDTLRESLKDGFSREDAANLDAVGRSMLQVAESIKNPDLRADFLAGARSTLEGIAKNSGPKAAAAVQEVVDKFDKVGLTHAEPKITADDSVARAKVDRVKGDMDILGRSIAKPEIGGNDNPWKSIYGKTKRDVTSLDGLTSSPTIAAKDRATAVIGGIRVDARALDSFVARPSISANNNASGIIAQVRAALANLNGTTATTYVRTIRQEFVNPQNRATGGYISGPGTGTSDSIPARLSNGEYVLRADAVRQYGRDVLDKMNTLSYARGGSVPPGGDSGFGGAGGKGNGGKAHDSFLLFLDGIDAAGKGLKGLKAALDKAIEAQKKQVEDARAARDAAVARRDALSSGIQQGLAADPFADQERSSNVWAAGASAGGKATPQSALAALRDSTARARRLVAALNTLKQKGITGPVLAEIIGTGDVERAEMMAALDMGTLTEFSSAFTENQQELAAAGLAGGNAVEAANIDATNKELRSQVKELKDVNHQLHSIEKAIERQDKNNQRGHKENAKEVKDGVNGAAAGGRRRGNGGRR